MKLYFFDFLLLEDESVVANDGTYSLIEYLDSSCQETMIFLGI
jgi:hypothetical protein